MDVSEPPSLISDELRDELGDCADMILPPKSKKDKNKQRRPDISPDIVEEVKKMSKKAQKRVEQIKKRKVKELKQSDYIKTINSHELTANHRQLMSSAQSLGQTLTLKQTVALLLKKEKAGMELTAEEKGILYTKSRDAGAMDMEDMPEELLMLDQIDPDEEDLFKVKKWTNPKKAKAAVEDVEDVPPAVVEPPPAIDLSDLFNKPKPVIKQDSSNKLSVPEDAPRVEATVNVRPLLTKKGKRQPLRKTAVAPIAVDPQPNDVAVKPSGKDGKALKKPLSIGKSLLQQLKNIQKSNEHKGRQEVEVHENICDEVVPENVYHIEEITAPVTDLGMINPAAALSRHTEGAKPRAERAKYVRVQRPHEIATARMGLPVCGMEQEIVEAVYNHDVIIVCGETGSGKSTQIPQFLYESGYAEHGLVGITQPRRVAVTSTAERVNYEMGQVDSPTGRLVGYQIRYDSSTVGDNTKIKFMTDGILLREITQDILLRQYSVIILDEAHERNINTDVLLGMISRALPLRKQVSAEEHIAYEALPVDERGNYNKPILPLKLVVMSATLRVTDFQSEHLFTPIPPVIKVEARQYPVTAHFAKKTELQHYLQATFKKVCQIHRKLPAGGVLVFLTGKREILYMCHKLQKALGGRKRKSPDSEPSTKGATNQAEDCELADIFDAEAGDKESGDDIDTMVNSGDGELDYSRYGQQDDMDEINSQASEDLLDEDDMDDDSDRESDAEKKTGEPVDVETPMEIEEEMVIEEDDDTAEVRRRLLAEVLGGDTSSAVPPADATDATSNAEPVDLNTSTIPEETLPMLKPLIFPLFAMMPATLQARIFAAVPAGYRLIVIATNVAETSITIPNISYVVDSGRQKTKVMSAGADAGGSSSVTVSRYQIQWVSKASADQRQGRAGRTGPGHCYRLYSANFYHEYLPDFQEPEIMTTPLEDLILQMKALGIKRIESFPFPSMPPMTTLRNAMKLLTYLGAVVTPQQSASSQIDRYLQLVSGIAKADRSKLKDDAEPQLLGELSVVGKDMARFPIHPRLSKMLIMACRSVLALGLEDGCQLLSHVLSLVAAMGERSPFVLDDNAIKKDTIKDEDGDESDEEEVKKKVVNPLLEHPFGDCLARLRGVGAYVYACSTALADEPGNQNIIARKNKDKLAQHEAVTELCKSYKLHMPTLQRILDLRSQLQSVAAKLISAEHLGGDADTATLRSMLAPQLSPPTTPQELMLRQLVLSGYCDSIARKAPVSVVQAKYPNVQLSRRKKYTAYFSANPHVQEPIYVHPQSNIYASDPTEQMPEFLVYHNLQRSTKGDSLYMVEVSVIDMAWIAHIAYDSTLLKFSAPLASPSPSYDASSDCIMAHTLPRYGAQGWKLPSLKKPVAEIMKLVQLTSASNAENTGDTSNTPLGYRKEDEEFRWLARFLLEGQLNLIAKTVLSADLCVVPPASITQNKMHPKMLSLLRQLVLNKITSRQALMKKLSVDGSFLSNEIQTLIKPEHRPAFRAAWQQLAKAQKC